MAKFILLLAVVCSLENVSSKHHHRHTKNDYKAYSRSNLLGSVVSTKEKPTGTDQEDYDHIIVVKNTKAITPEKPKPASSEKAVTKEPDFDHTIVVKTNAFQEDLPSATSANRVTPEKPETSPTPAKSAASSTPAKSAASSTAAKSAASSTPEKSATFTNPVTTATSSTPEKSATYTTAEKSATFTTPEKSATFTTAAKSVTSSTPAKYVESMKSSTAGAPIVPVKPATPMKPVSFAISGVPVTSGESATPGHAPLMPPKSSAQTTILSSGATEKTAVSKDKQSSSKSEAASKSAAKLQLEGISKGTGSITGFSLEKKTTCKSQYKRNDGNEISLKQVLDELFGEGKVPIETASRGFINADHFHFANDVGMITVSSCEEKGSFKVENLVAISNVMPVKWMELRHVKIKILEFHYEEMLAQKEDTPWSRMLISGNGNSYLGATKQETLIHFSKPIADLNNKPVDSDILILIKFNNEEYRGTVQASLFLSIFGQSLTSLYPDPPIMEISRLGLESLAFNRKNPKTHMIKGLISEANQYTVYITGEVSGSNLLSSTKDLYIVCQNDFSIILNNVNCALVATIDVGSFDFNSIVNDIELTDIAKEVKLFRGGKIPDTILFQSSKGTFETINANELQEKISPFTRNSKKRDKTSSEQMSILASTCFRYRLSNIGEQFPSIKNTSGIDILVNMYPGIDNIKFDLPDIGTIPVSQIPTLITDADTETSAFQKLFGDQAMEVEDLEVVKSDIGGGFKFIMNMKARITNQTGGFHFLPNLTFLEISQNPIKIIVEKNKKLVFEGSGEEIMLKSISNFVLGRKDNEPTISGEMKIRNSRILLDSLNQWMKMEGKVGGSNEGPFESLQSLTLPTLRYIANAGINRVIFSGSALLGDNPDSVFQMVAYYSEGTFETVTCIYGEKADVSEFINAVYGKIFFTHGWLKAGDIGILMRPEKSLPEISRFPRELCNIVDGESSGGVGADKITLFVNDFQLNDCGSKEKLSETCLFLKRVFKNVVPVRMVGNLSPKSLQLDGYTTKEMSLGPNLILKGLKDRQTDSRNEKIHIKITINEKIDQITFDGLLKFGGDTSKELPGKIILAGDSVMLQIPESTAADYLDIIRNDKLEFVQLTNTASSRRSISATKPLNMLVMNAGMKLGNTDANSAITFENKGLIKQFIDPATMAVKFYACKDSQATMEISDVLKAFGEGKIGVRGLLDNSSLKGLCVTYHEGKEKWIIEDLGLEVEPGLRLSATLETNFGNEGSEVYNIKSEMRIDDGKSVFCVVLPTLVWGIKERTITNKAGKTVISVPRMEMYFKEDSQSFGPELCYEFPFVGEHAFGYLTGYIKTIGVETDGEITIKSFETPGNMDNYMFEYSGELFAEVEGSLLLDAVYIGQDPSKIKFKVKINILEYIQKALKGHVIEFTQDRSLKALKQLNKAREYLVNFTRWKKEYDDQRIVLLTERQKNQNQFRRTKIDRARSMQSFSKDCSHDCGYVRVPGWIVDEKCGKSSNGRSLRCMNYAKDGHVASNVGCVASCEAERVRSLVEARELNDAAKEEGGIVDKNQNCLDLLQDVIQLINIYVEKMTESVAEMEKITQSHRDLASFNLENVDDRVQIDRIDADVLVDDLDDPSCLPFNIDAKVSFDQNDDVVKSYTKVKRCFNGMFVKKLVAFIFEDMMKSDIEAMDKYIETMDKKYASFEKILKKCSKNTMSRKIKLAEDAFNQCASADITQSNLKRRSIVESTLSPLRPSLFTIFRDSTVKAFRHNSPWSIADRRDAFDQLLHTQRKPMMHNMTTVDNAERACSTARRAAVDYGDIANYVRKWIKEQQAAKRTLLSVKRFIGDDVKKADVSTNFKNYTKDEIENMQYWMNKAKTGMSKWLSSEGDRIERHNKAGISLMRKELEFIYIDARHKTLREFFVHRSTDGTRALKKANIETPSTNIFPDLSKVLLNILESGKSLEEIAEPIEDTIKRIDGLEKRTILCNV